MSTVSLTRNPALLRLMSYPETPLPIDYLERAEELLPLIVKEYRLVLDLLA